MFKLVIDNREHKVISKISNELFVEVACLELGDFIIKKNDEIMLIIERKSLNDLLSSINDGRYREQKIRLMSNYQTDQILYFFEGKIKDCYKNSIKINNMINGALVNTILRDNISVIRTENVEETCRILLNIFQKVQNNESWFSKNKTDKNEIEYTDTVKISKKENMTPETCQIIQLSQIPGMSTTKSKIILEKYGGLYNLILEYEKLTEIKDKEELLKDIVVNSRKIGKVLSKRVYEYMISH